MRYNFDEIIPREGTACVKYDLRKQYFGRGDVIPLWVADMDFAVPGFVTEALKRRTEHPVYGYSILTDSYYQSMIDWMKYKHSWVIQKEWIAFSPGIVTGLNLLVQAFTKPGDKVVIQPPVYFPFFQAVENNQRKLLFNQLVHRNGHYEMDFDDLERKFMDGARMIILCSPHNPVGRVWTRPELAKLGALCMEHDVLIVSDEIHSDLVFNAYRHTPTHLVSEEVAARTITCVAPSKTFNLAGLATASVIISNPVLMKKFRETVDKVHPGINIFGAVASEAAYSQGREWLFQLIEYLQGNVDYVENYLREKVPGVTTDHPEATYLMWLDFSPLKIQSSKLRTLLVEKAGVGLNDGRIFGPGGRGFQRMNVGCPRALLERALAAIEKALIQ
jgi:cystathionine beta-lyase